MPSIMAVLWVSICAFNSFTANWYIVAGPSMGQEPVPQKVWLLTVVWELIMDTLQKPWHRWPGHTSMMGISRNPDSCWVRRRAHQWNRTSYLRDWDGRRDSSIYNSSNNVLNCSSSKSFDHGFEVEDSLMGLTWLGSLRESWIRRRAGWEAAPTQIVGNLQSQVDDPEIAKMWYNPASKTEDSFFAGLQRVCSDAIEIFIQTPNCNICMEQFSTDPQTERVALPCHDNHVFHLCCIESWLRDFGTCPFDRTQLCEPDCTYLVDPLDFEDSEEEEYDSEEESQVDGLDRFFVSYVAGFIVGRLEIVCAWL